MYRRNDGNMSQIAVATRFQSDCRQTSYPSVFTRTRSYLDWIKSNAGEITISSAQSIQYQLSLIVVGVMITMKFLAL